MRSVNAILLRVPTHSHSILFRGSSNVALVLFWFTESIQSLRIEVQQADCSTANILHSSHLPSHTTIKQTSRKNTPKG